MLDGFGMSYFDRALMPVLSRWSGKGTFRPGQGMMPSVTNTNNASICCGVWPSEHGITGNSYFDERTGREEFMESADMLLRPTLFERARGRGVESALLSSKKKTTGLLPRGASVVLTAEAPGPEWVERYGKAPDIYSSEINHWLLRVAADLLRKRPELRCLYVHTTDYPMHTWAPEEPESRDHLSKLDALMGDIEQAAPEAAFLVTADHDMNAKKRCWDLDKVCLARGVPLRASISADRDKYFKHHRGFGGVEWVYLKQPGDRERVEAILHSLTGVAAVMSREQAAAKYRTMASRIGELAVEGDRDTVFGHLEKEEMEILPAGYRSHGSPSELAVPIIMHQAEGAPTASSLRYNFDVARWLYRG